MKQSSLKKGMLALALGLVALVPSCRRRCYDCPPQCEETYCEEERYEETRCTEDGVVDQYDHVEKEYVEPVEQGTVYKRARKVRQSNRNGYNKKYVKEELIEEQVLADNAYPTNDVEVEQIEVRQGGAQPQAEYAKPANYAPETLDEAFDFES